MTANPRVAVYPGTFDPIHHGHLDIIRRARGLCDRLLVAIATNAGKTPLFELAERTLQVQHEIDHLAREGRPGDATLEVVPFTKLLMTFAGERGSTMVVRGLRAVSDFDYEFQMALNNKRLAPSIETVFLMAAENAQFISSRFVKEIHALEGDVSSMVPPAVLAALDARRR